MKVLSIILIIFLCMLLLFSATYYLNIKQYESLNDHPKVDRSLEIVSQSNRFQLNFLYMVSGLRSYLQTHEPLCIQAYDSALQDNEKIMDELYALVSEKSDQQILLDDIEELQDYWLDEFATPLLEANRLIPLSDSSRNAFNTIYQKKIMTGLEKDVQHSLQKKFAELINNKNNFNDSVKDSSMNSLWLIENHSLLLMVIPIVISLGLAWFISNAISSRLENMVKNVNTIAAGTRNIHLDEDGEGELSHLSKAINNMGKILNTSLSQLNRQQEEFDQLSHIVSQSIKSPLRTIDNILTGIMEEHVSELPSKVHNHLITIKWRIARVENVLKAIMTYAQISREIRSKEYVHIRQLLDDVMEYYVQPRLGITLVTQPDLPLLFTERWPLLQVFANLIGNAFKHHDKENGEVKVCYKTKGEFYEFFIQDDGPGINVIDHERIFLMFHTVGEKDNFDSIGMGLTIVKKILEDRNLEVNLTSQPNHGSTFSFTWPK